MKVFSVTSKFYISFVLITLAPATLISNLFTSYVLKLLPLDSYLYGLYSLGLVEIPTTLIVIFIFFWFTDHFLWKIGIVQKIFKLCNISGRYEGNLKSSFDKNKTYPIVVEIKQSLVSLFVTVYTENSSSYSLMANIGENNLNNWSISYVYQNKTSTVNENEDMKDHVGTCFLEILDDGVKLSGYYYNNPRDRGRHGSIKVERKSSSLLGHF